MANSSDKELSEMVSTLENSERRHIMKGKKLNGKSGTTQWFNETKRAKDFDYDSGNPYETIMFFDFSQSESFPTTDEALSDAELVGHEFSHAYDADTGTYDEKGKFKKGERHKDPNEIRATVNGNRVRRIEGRKKKTTYGGKEIDSKQLKEMENATCY
jgi:hypothetical protein